jgi:hypothetical protein
MLPDLVVLKMIRTQNMSEIRFQMHEAANMMNMERLNDTSIGNVLAFMRAFPDEGDIVKNCEMCLKNWLKAMYKYQVRHFCASKQIRKVLRILNNEDPIPITPASAAVIVTESDTPRTRFCAIF